MAPPMDTSFAQGWMVDIYSTRGPTSSLIYSDCALTVLVRASSLFERLAHLEVSAPRGYGTQTLINYTLPPGIASAAFIRVLGWIYAIHDISAHGDIEDPQITTLQGDGLTQYLRLLQAAKLLELKPPYDNQKRLPDMIKSAIKRGFDTKGNTFRNITVKDQELGLVWDACGRDRNEGITKLMLNLYVDAIDVRKENPNKYRDDIVVRFEALMEKNKEFKSAVIDVKTKKSVRLREEAREKRGEAKGGWGARGSRKEKRKSSADWAERWESRDLTESMVSALMGRPEEFIIQSPRGGRNQGTSYGTGEDGQY